MESLWLLVKIAYWWNITEKVLYAGIGGIFVKKGFNYVKDYKDSIEEETLMKQ